MRRYLPAGLLLGSVLWIGGCSGPPPPAVYNDHLLEAMISAMAAKDSRALDQYANRARSCHRRGQLSDHDYHRLEAIVTKARGGSWSAAQSEATELRSQVASQ